jgi:hypothetical protein
MAMFGETNQRVLPPFRAKLSITRSRPAGIQCLYLSATVANFSLPFITAYFFYAGDGNVEPLIDRDHRKFLRRI